MGYSIGGTAEGQRDQHDALEPVIGPGEGVPGQRSRPVKIKLIGDLLTVFFIGADSRAKGWASVGTGQTGVRTVQHEQRQFVAQPSESPLGSVLLSSPRLGKEAVSISRLASASASSA